MTWLINEDDALKAQLSGMTVTDEKNPARPVRVWFGQPDNEITEQMYPYIVIDLVDVVEDNERSMRGLVEPSYVPEGIAPPAPGYHLVTEFPVPIGIDYQVTTYSRNPRHDRSLISQILRTRLPFKFGGVEIPQDSTIRPVFMRNFAKSDRTEGGKKLFVNVFTVRMLSEVFPSQIWMTKEATAVTVTLAKITLDIPVNSP